LKLPVQIGNCRGDTQFTPMYRGGRPNNGTINGARPIGLYIWSPPEREGRPCFRKDSPINIGVGRRFPTPVPVSGRGRMTENGGTACQKVGINCVCPLQLRTNMEDKIRNIKIEYYRSRGPGGQRKNKKETAVRIRHIPTGITVIATEFRSQARNRQLALERLRGRLERRKKKKKPRIPTRIPASVKERVLKKKRLKSEKKRLRQRVLEW